MKSWLAPALAGAAVGTSILAAGGVDHPAVVTLALVGFVTFADLTRRAVRERVAGRRDPTDFWMSAAFAVILVGGGWDLGRDGAPANSWSEAARQTAGIALIAAGVILRRSAARALGDNFLVRLGIREGHTLVRSGPYRWIRHPTYTALLAVALGTAAALGSVAALAATLGVWLPIVFARMAREERVLLREFGDEYRTYAERTWKILPKVI